MQRIYKYVLSEKARINKGHFKAMTTVTTHFLIKV